VEFFFDPLEPSAYDVILADPPWSFKTYNDDISTKSARAHYSVSSLDDLKNMPVWRLAKPNCEMVMWATQAQIPDALNLVSAWGFTYKTMGAWGKRSKAGRSWAFGTGYVRRSCAEFYIVATVGSPKRASRSVRNFIEAPQREHSRKPDKMYDDIEALFPGSRKCELFARQRRTGWDSWGNEIGCFDGRSIG